MRLLRRDQDGSVSGEHEPGERGGPGIEISRGHELGDRHRDRRLPAPAPPGDGRGVLDRAERTHAARRHGSDGALLHGVPPWTEGTTLSSRTSGIRDAGADIHRRPGRDRDRGARGRGAQREGVARASGPDRGRAAHGVHALTADPRYLTVAELAQGLKRKRWSAVELANATCDLLERHGPRYNAIAAIVRDRAIDEARRADRTRRNASSALHGVPYAAKDLVAAKGARTTWGAPPYRDQTFDEDATVIAKLRRAGAVLAAKLAMVELAGGGGYRYPSASLQGPGRNPWNTKRWFGGSSSGSGAAVAAGLVAWAIGSETSGSIGTPSAYCGVTGLRPTYGLVSRHGAMALSWTLDKVGPMARSASDCAVVLAAIAGPDANDPSVSGKRFVPLDSDAARERLAAARIG